MKYSCRATNVTRITVVSRKHDTYKNKKKYIYNRTVGGRRGGEGLRYVRPEYLWAHSGVGDE